MRQNTAVERAVAFTLRATSYSALGLAIAGLVLQFWNATIAMQLMLAAVLFLLVTPVLRIVVLAVWFFREHDRKHGLIALAVLAIVIGSSLLGMSVR